MGREFHCQAHALEYAGRWLALGSRLAGILVAGHRQRVDSQYDVKTRVTKRGAPASAAVADCLVVIYSPNSADLGRRYELDRPLISVGRGRDNDIVLASDCVSRRHLRLEHRPHGLYVIDLGSTNGTYVNDAVRAAGEHRLERGDQLKIGDMILKFLSGSDVETQYHEIIFRMTVTDGLTNLANRKQLDSLLRDEVPRAMRHGRQLSLLMLDVDHFKNINDTYGHLVGDAVLRSLATILRKRLRPHDTIARYGGEEFCAVLPETDLDNAARIAEELRELVAAHTFAANDREVRVTISIGLACLRQGMQPDDLYRRADEMLYEAKRGGRNRVSAEA